MFAAFQVDVTNDALDWLLFGVGLATALATLLAVGVALLPVIRDARRRPRVSLGSPPLEWSREFPHAEDYVQALPALWVYNAPGKDPARDVEVFATLGRRDSDITVAIHVDRENLSFIDPTKGHGTARMTHIPPGFSRTSYLLAIGWPDDLYRAVFRRPEPGLSPPQDRFCVVPSTQARWDDPAWLGPGNYTVMLHVTGANFDALNYKARFAIEQGDRDGKTQVRFRWDSIPELYKRRWRRGVLRKKVRLTPGERPDQTTGWFAEEAAG